MNPNYLKAFYPFITILILVAIVVAKETYPEVCVLTESLWTPTSLSFQNMECEKEAQDINKPQVYIYIFLQRVLL